MHRTRVRILGWFVFIVAITVFGGLLLQWRILQARLDDDLSETMRQELRELEQLAGGTDPATGRRFTNVQVLFDLALARNVPLDGEAVVTFVDGQPYRATPLGERLFASERFVDEVSNAAAGISGSVQTDIGEARYQARPVLAPSGGGAAGVFAAIVFAEDERQEYTDTIRVSAIVALIMLAAATGVAWIVAGRVLRPVRAVTETARTITETDLRRRIPVKGDDEVDELAVTFNGMLDRLEHAFESQRAFIDDAGHELRTPLTIIQGHVELMPEEPEERERTLQLVQDELDRMARIVNDLLLLARAQRPDFLRLEKVDVTALLEGVHARAVALGDHAWRLRPPRVPVQIVADRDRLMQALLNLVANVVAHTPPDTVATIGATLAPDGTVRLWVHDDGPGLDVQTAERAFERFARGAGDRDGPAPGGAGLGLAIVDAIATSHDGRVELDSAPGRGATFTIVLPAAVNG